MSGSFHFTNKRICEYCPVGFGSKLSNWNIENTRCRSFEGLYLQLDDDRYDMVRIFYDEQYQ